MYDTVFTDRFWDYKDNWISPGVGTVPGSLIPYFGPVPAGDVGPIYGTPDQWINGLDYEVWQSGGYEGTPCFPFTCTNYKGKTRTGTSVSFSGGPSSGSIGDTHTGSTVNYAGGSVPFYFGHVHTGSSVSHIGGAPGSYFGHVHTGSSVSHIGGAPGSYFGHVHTGSSVSHIGGAPGSFDGEVHTGSKPLAKK